MHGMSECIVQIVSSGFLLVHDCTAAIVPCYIRKNKTYVYTGNFEYRVWIKYKSLVSMSKISHRCHMFPAWHFVYISNHMTKHVALYYD